MKANEPQSQLLEQFKAELGGFAQEAEALLDEIQNDLENKKDRFALFHHRMISIRGTAQQMEFKGVAHLAGLAEELALKAQKATHRAHIRKCVSALWDAMTTLKFVVQNPMGESTEEQTILENRLSLVLQQLGGAAQKVSAQDIEALLQNRGR